MFLRFAFLRAFLHVLGFFLGDRYNYSKQIEGNFKYMDTGEKVWWGYKSVVRQIEKAEKGKGIEEYFANQDLRFYTGEEFVPKNRVFITAGGDLSASEMIFPENTGDLWEDILEFYFSGDIVCANLEAPVVPTKPPVGVPGMCLTAPMINTSEKMFDRFIYGGRGVNFFATANNHSLDQGEQGLLDTLDFLDARGYPHVGTARTQEEQDDIPIVEKNGIKTAFISYTYSLNGLDPIVGKEYMTNVIRLNKPDEDLSLIQRHVKIAREKDAHIVVAMLHWSLEFETYPIENVIKMGHRVMECGVDVILGGHPHVAQPMEKYRFYDPIQQREKEGLIIYSLGELVSLNLFSKNSRLAMVVKIELTEGVQRGNTLVKITDLKVLPIYIHYKELGKGKSQYKILDLMKTLRNLEQDRNPHGFSEGEIKELRRLKRLFFEKILPKHSCGLVGNGSLEGELLCIV
ncbi:CapA family protein [Alkalicella caledoniensis]|uniref:CapA family protein n=1 Tax=Alkalicella caledoniensis TaxID=2731377 RepID=A0A7G9WBB9_ALKCA|nr:CapA family protein [Alkalicella caledoniensis]QNO15981.1 CapA family protein [Alkalicella caledoniensis]